MSRDDMEAEIFEFATDQQERARRYGEYLASQTADPLLKEKIFTLLSGWRVDH